MKDIFKEKNKKWMEPSAKYTKRTISWLFSHLQKDKANNQTCDKRPLWARDKSISKTLNEWKYLQTELRTEYASQDAHKMVTEQSGKKIKGNNSCT